MFGGFEFGVQSGLASGMCRPPPGKPLARPQKTQGLGFSTVSWGAIRQCNDAFSMPRQTKVLPLVKYVCESGVADDGLPEEHVARMRGGGVEFALVAKAWTWSRRSVAVA